MTEANVRADLPIGKEGFLKRMAAHQVNGVFSLGNATSPIDAAMEASRQAHALATFMSAALSASRSDTERELEELNPSIMVGAFDAIAFFSALANFHIAEGDTNGGDLERI